MIEIRSVVSIVGADGRPLGQALAALEHDDETGWSGVLLPGDHDLSGAHGPVTLRAVDGREVRVELVAPTLAGERIAVRGVAEQA